MKRFFPLAVSLTAFFLLFASCENPAGSDKDDSAGYGRATAKVDYKNSAAFKTVFFDFSTGTVTEADHNSWDIAVSLADGTIVANSGDYGLGALVFKSSSSDITADLSGNDGDITQRTFYDSRDAATDLFNTQSAANPFDGEWTAGSGSGRVYLVKDAAGQAYKVVFESFGPMGRYGIRVAEGLNNGASTLVQGTLEADYDYLYIDLGSASAVTVAPPKADWDIRFTRTEEVLSAAYTAGRSSILLNAASAAEGAVVADTAIEGVSSAASLSFTTTPDVLGHGWYDFDMASMIYSVKTVTLVVKTPEGNYAKMQPGTFYGPGNEQFYTEFRYLYQGDGSASFSL